MEHLSGGNLDVFLLGLFMVAGSSWALFLKPRIPIPAGLRSRFLRATLEVTNVWLRDYGGWAGSFFLPIGAALMTATLMGEMQIWMWALALLVFAVLAVWRLR